jgi:transposase
VYLLMTIPGVGMLTPATIWAKLGDPHRFRSPKQVVRYAGLDPSVEQSGERDQRSYIGWNGDRLLRRMLVEAMWKVARHSSGSPPIFCGVAWRHRVCSRTRRFRGCRDSAAVAAVHPAPGRVRSRVRGSL